jgi:hypothetical protein
MKIASLDPSVYRPPRLHVTRDVSTSLLRSVATDGGSLSVVSSFQYGEGGPKEWGIIPPLKALGYLLVFFAGRFDQHCYYGFGSVT